MTDEAQHLNFLVSLARAYYEQGLTQEQIAQSMSISRSQISRYLSQARDLGIVQIRVVPPDERADTLADELMERFPTLRAAIIVPVFSREEKVIRQMIGSACASYLKRSVLPNECLCIGCGRTIRQAIETLKSHPISGLSIVQAMGSLGHEVLEIDFNELARVAAAAFHARPYYLNAPAILGSGTAAALEEANVSIHESLERARQADVFLVGIGSLESDQLYARAGLLSQANIRWLQDRHIAGDICARFFDKDGKEQVTPFSDRIVGINLLDLKQGRLSIGIGGGSDKVLSLRGALAGGWINVVITDDHTARAILSMEQETRGGDTDHN